jgi:small subunit ribosomal protein S8e
MGISRSSKHKRRLTGGRMPIHQKKRKFEMGRQASSTKLGERKVVSVRGRGGNVKRRALRLNEGNFTWISEKVTRKCKILDVVYNATNNELVRTQTLVKGAIVAVDPLPFKYYWSIHYEEKKVNKLPEIPVPERKKALEDKREKNKKKHPFSEQIEKLHHFFDMMNKGKLLACITSRPGQSGRCDGYLLEGKELDFYSKKIEKK